MKCYKNHFGMIVSQILALFMSVTMAIAMLIINHIPITWVSFYNMCGSILLTVTLVLLTFVISYFLALAAAKLGEVVAIKSIGIPGHHEE